MTLALSIIQALLFYLVPVVIGRAVWILPSLVHKHEDGNSVSEAQLPIQIPSFLWTGLDFALGSLVIFGTALVIKYGAVLLFFASFQDLFFPIVTAMFCLALVVNLLRLPDLRSKISEYSFQLILGIASITIVSAGILSYRTPYPLNWDLFEHQTLVTAIQHGTYSFFTSQMSDSFGFNAYPPLFHTLIAISQHYFAQTPTSILNYWFVIGIFHLFLVTLASYLFGLVITENKYVACLSALFGGLVFESVLAFTNYLFLPQTQTAVLFVFLYSLLIAVGKKRQPSFLVAGISITALLLSHYVIGSLAVAIYLATFVYYRFPITIQKVLHSFPIVAVGVMLAIGGIFASFHLNLSSINHGEAAAYTFTLADKLNDTRRIYGYALFILVPLGILEVLKDRKKETQLVALFCVGFLAILCAQFPYVLKFFVVMRFFFHLLMALGIWHVVSRMKYRVYRWLALLMTAAFLCVMLIMNVAVWKQWLRYDTIFTNMNADDVAAAEFLQHNYAETKTMIISDPTTQYILEGLSGVNSPGGFAMTDRMTFDQVYFANTPAGKAGLLKQVKDYVAAAPQQRLYIYSGRTRLWDQATPKEKSSFDFSIWTPQQLSFEDIQYIQALRGSAQFQLVYQNSSMAIFVVKE